VKAGSTWFAVSLFFHGKPLSGGVVVFLVRSNAAALFIELCHGSAVAPVCAPGRAVAGHGCLASLAAGHRIVNPKPRDQIKMGVKVFETITAIADTTHAKPAVGYAITKLLASIDPNLPPPPPGAKYSVAGIDELLARGNLPAARRMAIKYELKMHGLLA
jgi:hypothetical protein